MNISDDLDVFERRILVLLQKDAARSTAEIAAEVGLSQAPCWRRIQKLKSKGTGDKSDSTEPAKPAPKSEGGSKTGPNP